MMMNRLFLIGGIIMVSSSPMVAAFAGVSIDHSSSRITTTTMSTTTTTSTTQLYSEAFYQGRTRKVAEAATVGKSRWGDAENQKALQQQQQQQQETAAPIIQDAVLATNPPPPAAPYQERTRKVAQAATVGKSRWGNAENQRALLQSGSRPLVPMAAVAATTTTPAGGGGRALLANQNVVPRKKRWTQAYPSRWENRPNPLSEQLDKQSGSAVLGINRLDYNKNPAKKVTSLSPSWNQQLSEVWNKGYQGGS